MTGVGHGKLILFGEHAAVHGFPALGLSLDLTTRVTVRRNARGGWRAPALGAADARVVLGLLELLAPGGGGQVRVRSDLPRGIGFGSSAALCVGLAAALSGARPPYGREVWVAAHRAETLFHGRPSGVDTGLSLLGGCRSFRPSPPDLPTERALPPVSLALVVGAVPRQASTRDLVASLGARLDRGDTQAADAIRALGDIAVQAEGAFLRGDASAESLGGLADRAQGVLAGLGLSTPVMDRLLDAGRRTGCTGGKLSGAGGGGAFYLVSPSPGHARSTARHLRRMAADLGLAGRGAARAVILPSWRPLRRS